MEELKIKSKLNEILIENLGKEYVSTELVNKVYDDYFRDESITSEEDVKTILKVIQKLFANFIDDSEFDEEE